MTTPGCSQSGPPSSQVNISGVLGSYNRASRNLQLLSIQSCNQKVSNVVNSWRRALDHLFCTLNLSGALCWTIVTISGNNLVTIHPVEKEQPFFDVQPYTLEKKKKKRSYACIYFWVTKKDFLPKNIFHTSLLIFRLQTFVSVKYSPPGISSSKRVDHSFVPQALIEGFYVQSTRPNTVGSTKMIDSWSLFLMNLQSSSNSYSNDHESEKEYGKFHKRRGLE